MEKENTDKKSKAEKFAEEFAWMQRRAHVVNNANGWWNERNEIVSLCDLKGINYGPHLAIELIGLSHSELSEGVEAARKHPPELWPVIQKDSMTWELADAIIRIMDMAAYFNLPVGEAIPVVIEANAKRGHMHGGKAA